MLHTVGLCLIGGKWLALFCFLVEQPHLTFSGIEVPFGLKLMTLSNASNLERVISSTHYLKEE